MIGVGGDSINSKSKSFPRKNLCDYLYIYMCVYMYIYMYVCYDYHRGMIGVGVVLVLVVCGGKKTV